MVDHVLALPAESAWLLLAPVVRGRKGEHLEWFEQARAQGFVRMRVDGRVYELEEIPKPNRKLKHDIEVVVDRSEEHTSELQSLMRTSYAVFCLIKKTTMQTTTPHTILRI